MHLTGYNEGQLRLLLVMEQCNPEWPSVPQVAFQIYQELQKICDVTLVTHERNRSGLTKKFPDRNIVFIEESRLVKEYYGIVARATSRGSINWPLQHTLSYPVYAEFDRQVSHHFAPLIKSGKYDAVMGMTPILPRYPYSLSGICDDVPFILGPVNGGLPFPDGFNEIATADGGRFNFLRGLTNLLPGYRKTYQKADRVIAGSLHTMGWIRDTFSIDSPKLCYMAENGVSDGYFENPIIAKSQKEPFRLFFAGRLVPYKGGDMLIEAVKRASHRTKRPLELTLVGDGPEREKLEQQTAQAGISDQVIFKGKVAPESMPDHFANADLFTFPSIREFGGAVVLEAMASGLPCVVTDHGGIGEYVTEESGVKIAPKSREYLIEKFAQAICHFADEPESLLPYSHAARQRAEKYRWSSKANEILELINKAIEEKHKTCKLMLPG
jgi:glycosyltransferase involved in cell wall biosynthesis